MKMGRRYFCDYCDKTFIDDLDARKKHLSSSHHIKLRKLHYEMHRDLRTILQEESIKTPCRRYFQNGDCQFLGNCKYTHYSQTDLWEIKQKLEYEKVENKQKSEKIAELPSYESWLEKYYQKHQQETNDDHISTFWTYPEHLEARTDLPPSLKKFQPEDFVNSDFEEWGI